MGVQHSQNVHLQNKHTENDGAEDKNREKNEIQRNLDEERMRLANESLRQELRKKEDRVLFYIEEANLARKVVVEYADALSTAKENERQLRSSILAVLNQEYMSASQKIKIMTSYFKQEERNSQEKETDYASLNWR